MKNQKIFLILMICLPALLLSGCWDVDEEMLEIFVESWAEHNGLYKDGKVSPIPIVQKVAEDTLRDFTNDEPFIQLDGLDVIRDIEKADQLADEALADLDTAKMSSAVSLRPNDWTLHEKESAVWSANGNQAAAQAARTKSDDLLRESVANGGDCMQLREQQLRKRRDYFLAASETCKKDPNCSDQEYQWLWAHYDTAQVMVNDIYIYEISPFCGTE